MQPRKFDGKLYRYWMSVSSRAEAEDKAAAKRRRGFSVRVVEIHYRQFDLYVRRTKR